MISDQVEPLLRKKRDAVSQPGAAGESSNVTNPDPLTITPQMKMSPTENPKENPTENPKTETKGRRVCSLALVADHIFHQVNRHLHVCHICDRNTHLIISDHIHIDHIRMPITFFHQEVGGGDVASTVLQMLYHVREANAVFLTKVINYLSFSLSLSLSLPTT